MNSAKILEGIALSIQWLLIVGCLGVVAWKVIYAGIRLCQKGKAERATWIRTVAGIFATCYAIYSIRSVFDCSYAPVLHKCIGSLALLLWGGWTIYTIDKRKRATAEKEGRD